MLYCFYNVNWRIDSFGNTVSVWEPSHLYKIIVSSEDKFILLPENFFKICAANCQMQYCFAASSFSQTSLYGYLPKEDTLGLTDAISKGVSVDNIF